MTGSYPICPLILEIFFHLINSSSHSTNSPPFHNQAPFNSETQRKKLEQVILPRLSLNFNLGATPVSTNGHVSQGRLMRVQSPLLTSFHMLILSLELRVYGSFTQEKRQWERKQREGQRDGEATSVSISPCPVSNIPYAITTHSLEQV